MDRISLVFVSPNHFGAMCSMVVCIIFPFCTSIAGRQIPYSNLVMCSLCFLGGTSGSRGAFVSLFVALIFQTALMKQHKWRCIALTLASSVSFGMGTMFVGNSVRFGSSYLSGDLSILNRLEFYMATVRLWLEKPWSGWGPDLLPKFNEWYLPLSMEETLGNLVSGNLQFLAQFGAGAFCLAAALIFSCAPRKGPFSNQLATVPIAIRGSLICFIVGNSFSVLFASGAITVFVVAVVVASAVYSILKELRAFLLRSAFWFSVSAVSLIAAVPTMRSLGIFNGTQKISFNASYVAIGNGHAARHYCIYPDQYLFKSKVGSTVREFSQLIGQNSDVFCVLDPSWRCEMKDCTKLFIGRNHIAASDSDDSICIFPFRDKTNSAKPIYCRTLFDTEIVTPSVDRVLVIPTNSTFKKSNSPFIHSLSGATIAEFVEESRAHLVAGTIKHGSSGSSIFMSRIVPTFDRMYIDGSLNYRLQIVDEDFEDSGFWSSLSHVTMKSLDNKLYSSWTISGLEAFLCEQTSSLIDCLLPGGNRFVFQSPLSYGVFVSSRQNAKVRLRKLDEKIFEVVNESGIVYCFSSGNLTKITSKTGVYVIHSTQGVVREVILDGKLLLSATLSREGELQGITAGSKNFRFSYVDGFLTEVTEKLSGTSIASIEYSEGLVASITTRGSREDIRWEMTPKAAIEFFLEKYPARIGSEVYEITINLPKVQIHRFESTTTLKTLEFDLTRWQTLPLNNPP
jgi:hypothetical protein